MEAPDELAAHRRRHLGHRDQRGCDGGHGRRGPPGPPPAGAGGEVPVALRFAGPKAWGEGGFDGGVPTGWLAEGLLMYLRADAQDRLFERVTELSAAGSRIAAETVGLHSAERRDRMRERFGRIAAQFGLDDTVDVGELTYEDPDRADVAQWLGAHGWRSAAVTSQDEMRRLGRAVELADTDGDSFATFVTAERR